MGRTPVVNGAPYSRARVTKSQSCTTQQEVALTCCPPKFFEPSLGFADLCACRLAFFRGMVEPFKKRAFPLRVAPSRKLSD